MNFFADHLQIIRLYYIHDTPQHLTVLWSYVIYRRKKVPGSTPLPYNAALEIEIVRAYVRMSQPQFRICHARVEGSGHHTMKSNLFNASARRKVFLYSHPISIMEITMGMRMATSLNPSLSLRHRGISAGMDT